MAVYRPTTGRLALVVSDISKRKQVEQALLDKSTELDTVLQAVPAAVWIAHDIDCDHMTGN